MVTMLLDGKEIQSEVLTMRLERVEDTSTLLSAVLADTGEENLVYLSAMVPPVHKRLIEELARLNRAKQAAVLRTIIDEWCEYKRAALEVK